MQKQLQSPDQAPKECPLDHKYESEVDTTEPGGKESKTYAMLPCPISSCIYSLTRLDRHIRQTHTDLSILEQVAMVMEP